MKGSTRERQEPNVQRKVLSDCAGMQLLLVYCPRLPFLNYIHHFMGLLALPQVNNSTSNRVGHARARYRVTDIGLVRYRLVPR